MKQLIFSLLIPLLIANSLFGQVASDYYPMHLGDLWIFDNEPIGNSNWNPRTVRWEIKGTDSIFGEEYLILERKEVQDGSADHVFIVHWLWADSLGNILIGAFGDTTNLDSVFVLDAPGPFFPNEFLILGYAREFEFEGVTFRDSVESISETVVVPLGTFTECVKISHSQTDSLGNVLRVEIEYYAQGVGMVLLEETVPDSDANRTELVEYSVQPVSAVSVGDNIGASNPNHFRLYQNYPNPFNPETIILYSIPKSDFVTLKIYDMLGREIQTLVSEFQKVDTYPINFDASKLSSGIYFYQLQVGDFVETKKMLFLR